MEGLVQQFFQIPGEKIHLAPGEFLFREGGQAKYFYFVVSGQISITKYAATGRELSLRLASSNSIIGELPLYQDNPAYIFNAIAKCKSEVYAIDFRLLEQYLATRPSLAIDLLKIVSEHMRKQHSKYRDLFLYGKKGALYSTLIRLSNSFGEWQTDGVLIPVIFTNQDLANYSATARESLNRLMSELRLSGVIEYRNKCIFIKDLEYLRQQINCENCDKQICNIE